MHIHFIGESDEDKSKTLSQSQSQLLQRDYKEDSHLFEPLKDNFDDINDKEESQSSRGRTSRFTDLYYPASMMFFMLFGPYGVCAFGFDITSVLTMNARRMDSDARSSKTMNNKSLKNAKKEESTYLR